MAPLLNLGLDAPDFTIGILALGILFLVSLLQQKFHAEGNTVRGILAQQNLPFRWIAYYGLIFSIIIFGFYGPGMMPVNLFIKFLIIRTNA